MDQLAVVWVDPEQDDEMQVDFNPPKPPVVEFHSISPALPRFDPRGLDWAPYTGRSSMAKPVEPAPVTPPARTVFFCGTWVEKRINILNIKYIINII